MEKVVSGGQTGVDRAALDAAMAEGIEVGGWCPSGRRAEDGRIDERYPLEETPSSEYDERTTWNVRDSDGTLVVAAGEPHGGTAFTISEARRLNQPVFVVDPTDSNGLHEAHDWLRRHSIRTLNVAGPRERDGSVYAQAYAFMRRLLAEVISAWRHG